MKIHTIAFALIGTTLSMCAYCAPAYDMRWFKNELTCADTKVTVHSFCKNEPEYSTNTFCVEQSITLEQPGKKKIERNLLAKEPSRGDFHSVRSLTCAGGEHQYYLYISLGNGGSCDTCENDAVMDLSGRWKRYGNRWYTSGAERKDIARHESRWFKQESVLLENKIEDREFRHD